MKKLLGVLITAIMLAGGLVAFTMSSANAACPYSGCISTSTHIKAPNRVAKGKGAKFCVRVSSDGNARPKGSVSVFVQKRNKSFTWADSRKYNEKFECFATPRLRERGKYIIKAVFDKKAGSRWKDSDNRDTFRVVRRR